MRKEEQEELPKVKWGDEEVSNSWRTRYLGSIFEAGGGCMTDIKARAASNGEATIWEAQAYME